VVLAAFKAAVRTLRGLRRWVRLPHASANSLMIRLLMWELEAENDI